MLEVIWHSQSLTSLCVMLYRAEKPSLATAMSVWKERDSRPEDDWISGGIFVPQYRPIRGATANTQININDKVICFMWLIT